MKVAKQREDCNFEIEYVLKANFECYLKGRIFNKNLGELLADEIFSVDVHLWKIERIVS